MHGYCKEWRLRILKIFYIAERSHDFKKMDIPLQKIELEFYRAFKYNHENWNTTK